MADDARLGSTIQGFDVDFLVSTDKKGPLSLGYRDLVFPTDDVDTQAIFNRVFMNEDDEVEITDALATSLVMNRTLAVDAVTMSDALSFTWVRDLTLDDAVEMTDLFVRSGTYVRTFTDAILMSDTVMVGMAGQFNVPVHDVAGIVDDGVVSKYDYAGPDYFVAPGDYVGDRRVF